MTGAVVLSIIAIAAATTMILLRLLVARRGRAKMSQKVVRVRPVLSATRRQLLVPTLTSISARMRPTPVTWRAWALDIAQSLNTGHTALQLRPPALFLVVPPRGPRWPLRSPHRVGSPAPGGSTCCLAVEIPPGVELLTLSLSESGLSHLAKAVEHGLTAVAGDVDARSMPASGEEGVVTTDAPSALMVGLDDEVARDSRVSGGKAAVLARLRAGGLPVPEESC